MSEILIVNILWLILFFCFLFIEKKESKLDIQDAEVFAVIHYMKAINKENEANFFIKEFISKYNRIPHEKEWDRILKEILNNTMEKYKL